jgi:hypothetical protein
VKTHNIQDFCLIRRISVYIVSNLPSGRKLFGSRKFAPELSLVQSVLYACHTMPRVQYVPVVHSGEKYPSEFEVNGISPSNAVTENAYNSTVL